MSGKIRINISYNRYNYNYIITPAHAFSTFTFKQDEWVVQV